MLKWCNCLLKSGLFLLIQKASLSLRSIELFAVSKIRKQEGVYMPLHEGNWERCLKICEFLSLTVCSLILVEKKYQISNIKFRFLNFIIYFNYFMCPLLVKGFCPRLECIWHINKVIDWLIDWLIPVSFFLGASVFLSVKTDMNQSVFFVFLPVGINSRKKSKFREIIPPTTSKISSSVSFR